MAKKSEYLQEERLKALGIGNADEVDAYIGLKLRRRRSALGISQNSLANALGLTFQQVQKYEKGATRISIARLWDLSKILSVPITYFFENLEGKTFTQSSVPYNSALNDKSDEFLISPLAKRDVRELVTAYCSISKPQTAKDVLRIVKDLADKEEKNKTDD